MSPGESNQKLQIPQDVECTCGAITVQRGKIREHDDHCPRQIAEEAWEARKQAQEEAERRVQEEFVKAHPFPPGELLTYELAAEPGVVQAFTRYKDAWNEWRHRPTVATGMNRDNAREKFYAEVGRVKMGKRDDR